MSILPDWAPNIHPLLVHFPIVAFLFALLFDSIALFLKGNQTWRNAALIIYGLGFAAVIATYWSGQQAADSVQVLDDILPAISNHSDWATRAFWFWIAFVPLRYGIHFRRLDQRKVLLGLFVFASLIGNYLIFETAERGARLVYQYGVGTAVSAEQVKEAKPEPGVPGKLEITEKSLTWRIGTDAPNVLRSRLQWKASPPENVAVRMATDSLGPYLELQLDRARAAILFPKTFADLSLEVLANLDGFRGQLILVHHFSDSTTYDYLAGSPGGLILGRAVNDRLEKLDEQVLTVSGWNWFKVVGTSGHYRGYLNGKLQVHGHSHDLPPGRFGILLEGSGTVKLREVNATKLKPHTE